MVREVERAADGLYLVAHDPASGYRAWVHGCWVSGWRPALLGELVVDDFAVVQRGQGAAHRRAADSVYPQQPIRLNGPSAPASHGGAPRHNSSPNTSWHPGSHAVPALRHEGYGALFPHSGAVSHSTRGCIFDGHLDVRRRTAWTRTRCSRPNTPTPSCWLQETAMHMRKWRPSSGGRIYDPDSAFGPAALYAPGRGGYSSTYVDKTKRSRSPESEEDLCTGSDEQPNEVTYLTAFGSFGREGYAYVAQEKGFFAKCKIRVDIQPGQGVSSNLQSLASGKAQFSRMIWPGADPAVAPRHQGACPTAHAALDDAWTPLAFPPRPGAIGQGSACAPPGHDVPRRRRPRPGRTAAHPGPTRCRHQPGRRAGRQRTRTP
jgi:hypothetical protein